MNIADIPDEVFIASQIDTAINWAKKHRDHRKYLLDRLFDHSPVSHYSHLLDLTSDPIYCQECEIHIEDGYNG